jgi:hypothetical protein
MNVAADPRGEDGDRSFLGPRIGGKTQIAQQPQAAQFK